VFYAPSYLMLIYLYSQSEPRSKWFSLLERLDCGRSSEKKFLFHRNLVGSKKQPASRSSLFTFQKKKQMKSVIPVYFLKTVYLCMKHTHAASWSSAEWNESIRMSLTNSLWQKVVWVEFFWIGVPFGIAVKAVYLDEKGNSSWYRVLSCKMLRP